MQTGSIVETMSEQQKAILRTGLFCSKLKIESFHFSERFRMFLTCTGSNLLGLPCKIIMCFFQMASVSTVNESKVKMDQ